MPASDPFTQEAIDKMIADADPDWDDTKRETRMSGYVRALAAEVNRLRASRPEWQKCRQEQIEAIRERDQARADLAAAKATIATLTEERDEAERLAESRFDFANESFRKSAEYAVKLDFLTHDLKLAKRCTNCNGSGRMTIVTGWESVNGESVERTDEDECAQCEGKGQDR